MKQGTQYHWAPCKNRMKIVTNQRLARKCEFPANLYLDFAEKERFWRIARKEAEANRSIHAVCEDWLLNLDKASRRKRLFQRNLFKIGLQHRGKG